MEQRQLGASGLRVPVLGFGTGTFGGSDELFRAWGTTGQDEARRLLDICIEAGVTMFDTADMYSAGMSEEILGDALRGRRDQALISTKAHARVGEGPNDVGSSRHHLLRAVEASLRRLGTDYIDIFYLHGFDALTPVDEVLQTLDALIAAGKIRYVGVSNFSGWHLMKALGVSDRRGLPRYVAQQAYYSLANRDFEWELMPLGIDQNVATVVWSPLGWARLTGKIRRGTPVPDTSRLHKTAVFGPEIPDERLYAIVDALAEIGLETGKTVPQVAINWLLQRPTVASVLIGARDERQLRDNLGAIGWSLTPDQVRRLDAVSAVTPPYPYWHQRNSPERLPLPV